MAQSQHYAQAAAITTEKGCKICEETCKRTLDGHAFYMELPEEIFKQPPTDSAKRRKKQKVTELLEVLNALMNKGRGIVCIHTQILHFLGLLDEQLDPKLSNTISDGTLFPENFERYFKDDLHVIFRVKPRKNRTIVTFASNTKVPLDVGIVDPTYHQLEVFIKKIFQPRAESGARETTFSITFTKNNPVKMTPGVFQENSWIQAKSVKEENVTRLYSALPDSDRSKWVRALAQYMWSELSLPEYISAFSKLDGGGRIYFGLYEKKLHKDLKWKLVQDPKKHATFFAVQDHTWKVWEDLSENVYLIAKKASNSLMLRCCGCVEPKVECKKWKRIDKELVKDVVKICDEDLEVWEDTSSDQRFHVAKPCHVPVRQEIRTGEFVCEGIQLPVKDREDLKKLLQENVQEKMMWIGQHEPENPITLSFHDLDSPTCIVEVNVNKYHGISFYTQEGPCAYTISTQTGRTPSEKYRLSQEKLEKLSPTQWLSGFVKGDTSLSSDSASLDTAARGDVSMLPIQTPVFQD